MVSAIPSVLQKGKAHAAPPFIIDLLLLGLGAGVSHSFSPCPFIFTFSLPYCDVKLEIILPECHTNGLLNAASCGIQIFKPNIAPIVLDQNRHQKPYTTTLKSGEKVIVDPETTASRTMLIFYDFVNVGAFFMVATTHSEK